jgi:hypothetical protein
LIILFKSNYKIIKRLPLMSASIAELEKEVSMYSASVDFLRKNGGPIANMILSSIPKSFFDEAKSLGLHPNISIRVHRLNPGDYPAYPGWHCDGHHREGYDSQPNASNVTNGKHIICTISSCENGVSNPEFIDSDVELSINKSSSENIWGQVHKQVSDLINNDKIRTSVLKDGQLTQFDNWTIHRATSTKSRGWRLFFRISMWNKEGLGDGGMISKQEQIYKVLESSGW